MEPIEQWFTGLIKNMLIYITTRFRIHAISMRHRPIFKMCLEYSLPLQVNSVVFEVVR